MKWFQEFLEDRKLLRSIQTYLVIALIIIFPVIWWGIIENLRLDAEITNTLTVFGIIAYISTWLYRMEISYRAKFDEEQDNEEIKNIYKDIILEVVKPREMDYAVEFMDIHNEKEQNIADKILTTRTVDKKKIKLVKFKLRKNKFDTITKIKRPKNRKIKLFNKISNFFSKNTNKISLKLEYKIEKLNEEIKFLKENPLYNAKCEPIQYDDLIEVSEEESKSNKTFGRSKIRKKVVKSGNKIAAIFGIFRSVGVGAGAVAAWVWDVPFEIVATYFGLLILSLAWITIRRYPKIRLLTKTEHLNGERERFELLKKMNIYSDDRIIEENLKEEQRIIDENNKKIEDELENSKLNKEKESRIMTKEEKKKVEDFCTPCMYYGFACAGLTKKEIEKGLLDCDEKEYKKEGEK